MTESHPAQKLLLVTRSILWGGWDHIENLLINIHDKLLPNIFPHKADVTSLNDQVCIVTGGNAGIGYATAKMMAERGAHVVLACRDRNRALQAVKELLAVTPLEGCHTPKVEFMQCDLASLKSVREFCNQYLARGLPLHVLLCNAGIMSPPERIQTQDGLELQFQANFLGHWLMAVELSSRRRRRGPQDKLRVVFMSSLSYPVGKVQWHDKQSEGKYGPFVSYALSKMCTLMAALHLERRFRRHPELHAGDSAVALHPGIVATHLAGSFYHQTASAWLPWLAGPMAVLLDALIPWVMRTPDSAAANVLRAATAPAERVGGRMLSNAAVMPGVGAFACSEARQQELWELAERLTGVTTPDDLA